MASAGWRNDTATSSTSSWPVRGRSEPARMSNSSSWPWPSSATTPSTSPAYRSNDTSASLVPRARPCARIRGVVALASPWVDGTAPPVARAAGACGRSPSMSLTIRSSDPSSTSTTPTVSPSRSTVARSHTAAISIIRCEMKITDWREPRRRPMTSSTRSVRSAGSAAVISSSIRTSGSIARARARSMTRSVASGRLRAAARRSRVGMPSSASQWRQDSTGVRVRRRLDAMSRSGTSDGSWYTDTMPTRRASPGERAA